MQLKNHLNNLQFHKSMNKHSVGHPSWQINLANKNARSCILITKKMNGFLICHVKLKCEVVRLSRERWKSRYIPLKHEYNMRKHLYNLWNNPIVFLLVSRETKLAENQLLKQSALFIISISISGFFYSLRKINFYISFLHKSQLVLAPK